MLPRFRRSICWFNFFFFYEIHFRLQQGPEVFLRIKKEAKGSKTFSFFYTDLPSEDGCKRTARSHDS